MLWIRTKAFEDLSSGMYKRFWRMYKSLLHYSGKWLLGKSDVGSSVTCTERQWISRTDPKKTCWVRFNLQEIVPIVFGDHSDFGRHALDVISSMECPSLYMTSLLQNVSPPRILIITNAVHSSKNSYCLGRHHHFGSHHRFGTHNQSHHISATPLIPKRSHRSYIHPSEEDQSIRRHPKSMTRSPPHPQPFPDSGARISGTSQTPRNQKKSHSRNQSADILLFRLTYPPLLTMNPYPIFLLILSSVVVESGSAIIPMSYFPQLRISNPSSAIRCQQRDSILCVRTHLSNINQSILTRIRTLNFQRHAYIKGEHAKVLILS